MIWNIGVTVFHSQGSFSIQFFSFRRLFHLKHCLSSQGLYKNALFTHSGQRPCFCATHKIDYLMNFKHVKFMHFTNFQTLVLEMKNSVTTSMGRLGSRVVSVLDSGAEGPGFKSQSRRCRVTVLGKLFTPTVPLFTKQHNW